MRRRRSDSDTAPDDVAAETQDNPGFDKAAGLLSSGSTMLNIACSGNPAGAFMPGRYYFFVGDSSSGKTFSSTGICAEAVHSPVFSKYRIIYDDAERGNNINIEALFGRRTKQAIEAPRYTEEGEPDYSYYIEDFYDNLNSALTKAESNGRPVLYILDSMDALGSKAEELKDEKNAKAREEGEAESGSYGDGKAKYNSQHLRTSVKRLANSGSILIIISQTRDVIATGPFKPKGGSKGRSGGHALRFYATLEMWTSRVETITKNVLGKPRQVGIRVKVQVKKNRITGQEPAVEYPIYYSVGIDDTGSCVDYLVSEGVLEKAGRPETLVAQYDTVEGMQKLRQMVWERWQDILDRSKVNRRIRYIDEDEE